MRRCGALARGSSFAAEVVVERSDRNENVDQVLFCQRREQIEIALDQRVLGHDRQRMAVFGEHLDDLRA